MKQYDPRVYGYVNGKPVYSRDEYVFAARGFGAIESDAELMAFAEKASHGWYDAGWKQKFEGFYLSDYALAEPRHSLTDKEFARLKVLQVEARAALQRAEEEKRWQLVDTVHYADNSVEEVYEDKDGNRRYDLVTGPHGDVCY